MTYRLKPCPFCGGEAVLRSPKKLQTSRSAICSSVECADCYITGEVPWPWENVPEYKCKPRAVQDLEAINLWNRRSKKK
jgi:Lar family restriction alleviation protein